MDPNLVTEVNDKKVKREREKEADIHGLCRKPMAN